MFRNAIALTLVLFGASSWAITSQQIYDHFATQPDWSSEGKDTWQYNAQRKDLPITRVAVAWRPTLAAVQQANTLGCQLFVCYKEIFPNGTNYPGAQSKIALLNSSGMVVLRCHDVWKKRPGNGIRDSLRDFLGLAPPLLNAATSEVAVYAIPRQTAQQFAQRVADRVLALGLDGVELLGNANKLIERVGIGTGDEREARTIFLEGGQLAVVTEFQRYREGWWAVDNDVPLLAVDRVVAETPGVMNLAAYIAAQWPSLDVRYIPIAPSHTFVSVAP